jgi:hypothetical protein
MSIQPDSALSLSLQSLGASELLDVTGGGTRWNMIRAAAMAGAATGAVGGATLGAIFGLGVGTLPGAAAGAAGGAIVGGAAGALGMAGALALDAIP